MNYKIMFFLLSILLFVGCGGESNADNTEKSKDSSQNVKAKTPPALSGEELSILTNSTKVMDYIFFDLPYSINIDQPSSIFTMMSYVTVDTPVNYGGCGNPIATIMFNMQDGNQRRADLFFSNTCAYYVFYDESGSKVTHANEINDFGKEYYNKIVNSSQPPTPPGQ